MNQNIDPRGSDIYRYIHPSCGSDNLQFIKLQKEEDTVLFQCCACMEKFSAPFKGGHLLTAEDNLRIVYP